MSRIIKRECTCGIGGFCMCPPGGESLGKPPPPIGLRTASAVTLKRKLTLADALALPEVKALVEAGGDARAALLSAKEFILRRYGSTNPAREEAIVKLDAALRRIAEDPQ